MIVDLHEWRGAFVWPSEPDLFHGRITVGWVTIWVCRFCVSDRLRQLAKMMEGK